MGSFHSFAQVLEKKIRRELEEEMSFSPAAEPIKPTTELWSSLVGNMDPIHFSTPIKRQVYDTQKKPTPPKPPYELNAMQAWAMQFFTERQVALSPRFLSKELQSAFRKLALRMHPDQGGSPIEFQNLMTARAELAKLL